MKSSNVAKVSDKAKRVAESFARCKSVASLHAMGVAVRRLSLTNTDRAFLRAEYKRIRLNIMAEVEPGIHSAQWAVTSVQMELDNDVYNQCNVQ